MTELLLIVSIAGQRVALRASEVQSVIELETLAPVPRTAAHVAGLSALRSRVLTVVDCRSSLGLPAARQQLDRREAAVVDHEGHHYALLVDSVEDVVECASAALPLAAGLGSGWDRVSLGIVEAGGEPLILVDIGAMISGPDFARAA